MAFDPIDGEPRRPIVLPPSPIYGARRARGEFRVLNAVTGEDMTHSDGGACKIIVSETGKFYWLIRTLRQAIYGCVRYAAEVRPTPGDERTLLFEDHAQWRRAIKCMNRQMIMQMVGRHNEDPLKEIAVMQHLANPGHPHVMAALEVCQDDTEMYAVLPYVSGGELFNVVEANGAFSEAQARRYFINIMSGMEYLQSQRICHRDMSLENLMLSEATEAGYAIIIDFGMALCVPHNNDGTVALIRPQGRCGKMNYMSPEIYNNDRPFHGFAIDIWAVGIILFIMITGIPPFERPAVTDQRFQHVIDGRLGEMLQIWQVNVSEAAVDLIQRMLRFRPEDRPTLQEIASHPWVQGHSTLN